MVTYHTKTSAQGTWQYLSVHCLLNQQKVVDIPDDLESIFHVLLYYAVRYLPHNVKDDSVGLFLHRYFDDYSTSFNGATCNSHKFAAMITGEINLTLLTGGKIVEGMVHQDFLTFYLYPLPLTERGSNSAIVPLHPINALLSTLLKSFKDFYALTKISPQRHSSVSNAAAISFSQYEDLEDVAGDDPDLIAMIPPPGTPPPPPTDVHPKEPAKDVASVISIMLAGVANLNNS